MSAVQTAVAKASAPPQAAMPMRRSTPPSAFAQAPLASLSAIPAMPLIQRKCAACEDEESQVQPRLEVGPVGDRYEMEADSIAAQVMAMRDPGAGAGDVSAVGSAVQRACSACSSSKDEPRARRLGGEPEEEEAKVRASRDGGPETIAASDSQLTGGGAPLPASTRSFFEQRMGRDLSDVRVHQGGGSAAMNDSISARAFTYKNHVWLGAGESASPSFTMAHELAHVMQQTAPGPVGAVEEADATTSAVDPAVQRKDNAFWLPGKTVNAKNLHKRMHDQALTAIRKENTSVLTEVPIPGANRQLVDVGATGRADIYTAAKDPRLKKIMVPGVEQVQAVAPGAGNQAAPPDQSAGTGTAPGNTAGAVPVVAASIAQLNNFSPNTYGNPMMQGAKKTLIHDSHRAPKIDKGRLTDVNDAPTDILIGEMKPAHDLEYRKSGAKQVANYMEGIKNVAGKVNEVVAATGGNSDWKPNPKVIGSTLLLPPTWDSSKPQSDWDQKNLKIRFYDSAKQKKLPGKSKSKSKVSQQGRPKTQPIRGRWMMAADNAPGHNGVFVYFLAPNPDDLADALKPQSTKTEFRKLSTKVKKVQHDLIAAPKKVQPLRKSNPPIASLLATPEQPRVKRKVVKDGFKAATWEAERTGSGLKSGAQDDSLLGAYTDVANNDLREEIADQGAMVEWLKTKPETKGTTYPSKPSDHADLTEDFNLLKSVEFWSGPKAWPFGRLREKFGNFFVKAFVKVSEFGQKVMDKFHGWKEEHFLKSGPKGTIMKAAAKVATVVLPRIAKPFLSAMLDTIIDCGISGFEAKFRKMIEGTFIDDLIDTAEEIREKVDGIADEVESFFGDIVTKTIGPIEADFKSFIEQGKAVMEVAQIIAEIAKAARIGSCIAGLIAAPETVGIGAVVGCGAALADYILSKFGLSPVEYFIARTLQSCETQNEIGAMLSAGQFIKGLPSSAGLAIVKEIKSILKNSETLNKLGTLGGVGFGVHASELFCEPAGMTFPEMKYEESDCSDGGGFKQSKTGEYEIPDSVKEFKKGDPESAKEQRWKGVEVPSDRTKDMQPQDSAVNPFEAPPVPPLPQDPASQAEWDKQFEGLENLFAPDFSGPAKAEEGVLPDANGSSDATFILHPPVSRGSFGLGDLKREILICKLTIWIGSLEVGPLEVSVALINGTKNEEKSAKAKRPVHEIKFEVLKDYIITKGEGKWGLVKGNRTGQEGAAK